jgi:transcriptional antiterminator
MKRRQLNQLLKKVEDRSYFYNSQFVQKLRRQAQIPDISIRRQQSVQKIQTPDLSPKQQSVQKTQTPDLSPTQKQSVQKLRQKPKTPLPSGFSFFGRQGGSHKKGQYESYTLFGEHGLFNIFPKESKVSTDAGTA